ncbi:MAG TPA: class I SAM-dependent methyltransferase [Vicinamibacterales bacterium]|nr:class I SAM-dependent methyltransferase [Vicinamibacterales bacterium]
MTAALTPVAACWVCGGARLARVHDARLEFSAYRQQDPELAAYSGHRVAIVRCHACGFAQPASLPALPRYFDRMYDQHWSADWVEREHRAPYKDRIFDAVLVQLERRVPGGRRRLLDIGAHAGRFIARARARGWDAEGLELNPRTAAYAAAATGGRVHQGNLYTWSGHDGSYDAVTMTDVLEHIPDPRSALRRAHALLAPGGWIAVKVPNAPIQRLKERARAWLRPGYQPALADNLVHVNHFGPSSLRAALAREGFGGADVFVAPPEMPEGEAPASRLDRLTRTLAYRAAAALPGGTHSPLAFNLQAYARRD